MKGILAIVAFAVFTALALSDNFVALIVLLLSMGVIIMAFRGDKNSD